MIIKKIFINLHQPHVILCTLLYQIFAPRLFVLTETRWCKELVKNHAHLAQDDTSDFKAMMLMVRKSVDEYEDASLFFDSGSFTHITGKKEWFVKMKEVTHGSIKFADDRSLSAEGYDGVMLRRDDGRAAVIEEV